MDYRAFGDIAHDVKAKRKYLRATTRTYMETYIKDFLSQNKLKENLFPNSLIDTGLAGLDALPDSVVLQTDEKGYAVLKAQMDQSAAFYYRDYFAASKSDKNRAELLAQMKQMEKRAIDTMATKDKQLEKILVDAGEQVRAFNAKIENRLAAVEAKVDGIRPSANSSSKTIAPGGLTKNERMMIFAALGLSVLSLGLSLLKSR